MSGSTVRIDPDRTLLKVKAGKLPQIFLQPGKHIRRKKIFEDRGPERAVLNPGIEDAASEFCSVDFQKLAEIAGVDIFDLGGSNHQVVENGIVKDRPVLAIIDYPAGWIDTLAIKGILLGLLFVFFGYDLQ